MRSPSAAFEIAITMRICGLISCARSAAWKLPRSSCSSNASPRACCRPAASRASALSSARSSNCTSGITASFAPGPALAVGTMAVTGNPYLSVISSASRVVSAFAPQMMM